MLIKIEYESKYSLATTKNGENILKSTGVITANEQKDVKKIFSSDNNFLKNIKKLNQYYPNYRYADITQDTILGILCRLVGEVRRLNSLDAKHPIIALKESITFENINTDFQNEVIMLHSPLKEVPNNAGGIISKDKEGHFLLTKNALSETLLSVFNYQTKKEIEILLKGLIDNDKKFFYENFTKEIDIRTFLKEALISDKKKIYKGINFSYKGISLKDIKGNLYYGGDKEINLIEQVIVKKDFEKVKEILDSSDIVKLNQLHTFLFAKKIQFLRKNGLFKDEFEKSLNTDKTSIKGVAPATGYLTPKDYYTNFMNEKKMSWTIPYSVSLKKDLFDNQNEKWFNSGASIGVTKESGVLLIRINIPYEDAVLLYQKIDAAGVNTFQLGKKGLAYISEISLEE